MWPFSKAKTDDTVQIEEAREQESAKDNRLKALAQANAERYRVSETPSGSWEVCRASVQGYPMHRWPHVSYYVTYTHLVTMPTREMAEAAIDRDIAQRKFFYDNEGNEILPEPDQ